MQQLLLQQTTIMFILIGVGYVFTKFKMLTMAGSKELSVLLVNVAFPCVVLDAFISAGRDGMGDLVLSFQVATIGLLVSMAVAYIIYGTRKGVECFGASFSNAGFMGVPLVLATFGQEGVLYVTGVITLLNILQWTYGVVIMTRSTEAIQVKKLAKNPIIIAVFLGIIAVYQPFALPAIVLEPINFAKNLTTPLAMIIVGISLAQTNLLEAVKDLHMYIIAAVRLILIPLVTMLVFKYITFASRDMLLAMMVVLSAPIGSNVAIAAQVYNQDAGKAVRQVCFTTLLSIVTIPIIMGIVENFL